MYETSNLSLRVWFHLRNCFPFQLGASKNSLTMTNKIVFKKFNETFSDYVMGLNK